MLLRLDKLLSPMVSAWMVVIYIQFLQNVHFEEIVQSKMYLYLLFLPIALFEFMLASHFRKMRSQAHVSTSNWRRWLFFVGIGGNVLFWYVCFWAWVIKAGEYAPLMPTLYWFGPHMYEMVLMLWKSMQWISGILIVLWLLVHYMVTLRGYRFRILTSCVLPGVLTLLLFLNQFYFGGFGGRVEDQEIEAQTGVKKILSVEELEQAIIVEKQTPERLFDGEYLNPNDHAEVRYQPRGLCVDEFENAIFIVLGCTYCNRKLRPVLIRKDLTTGEIQYLLSRNNVRRIACKETSSSIFLATWMTTYLYEISKHDLSLIRTIPNQTKGLFSVWEPMGIRMDVSGNQIYVFNGQHSALISYDVKTGALKNILDFQKAGFNGKGGASWYGIQSKKTRKLYVMSAPGEHNFFEINPDTLQVTRSLLVGKVIGSDLILDDENGLIYSQSFMLDSIYRINIESFTIEREYEGEFFARRLLLDKPRQVLYVLGYLSGLVFSIDLQSGKRLWEVKVGGRPHGMDLSGNLLWINSMSGVFHLDLSAIWKAKGYSGTRFDLSP